MNFMKSYWWLVVLVVGGGVLAIWRPWEAATPAKALELVSDGNYYVLVNPPAGDTRKVLHRGFTVKDETTLNEVLAGTVVYGRKVISVDQALTEDLQIHDDVKQDIVDQLEIIGPLETQFVLYGGDEVYVGPPDATVVVVHSEIFENFRYTHRLVRCGKVRYLSSIDRSVGSWVLRGAVETKTFLVQKVNGIYMGKEFNFLPWVHGVISGSSIPGSRVGLHSVTGRDTVEIKTDEFDLLKGILADLVADKIADAKAKVTKWEALASVTSRPTTIRIIRREGYESLKQAIILLGTAGKEEEAKRKAISIRL